nr:hypothetical protein GCM10020092_065340 [Actinoplanes digitatis]
MAVVTRPPICFYYGDGHLEELATYPRVVLQPDFYSPQELALLADKGVQTLGYLTLSEDQGPPAPWQRKERNPDWGGAFVEVGHPLWVEHVVGQAKDAMAAGFAGLFMDTLNVELTWPEDIPHLLTLVAAIRTEAKPGYLLANRGFGMLPQLAELVDGVVFESFSARWTEEGYAPWPSGRAGVPRADRRAAPPTGAGPVRAGLRGHAGSDGLRDAPGAAVRHAVRGERPGTVPGVKRVGPAPAGPARCPELIDRAVGQSRPPIPSEGR